MHRYGRDYYPRYDRGYRGAPGYGGDYGRGYGARYEQPRHGRPLGGEGWGYGRDFARALPPGNWRTGEPWGGRSEADEVSAADIMTRNPEAVTPDTTLVEVARRMRDLDVGIMPVVDDEDSFRLQGVITDRDIAVRAAAEGKDMAKARVEEFMTREVETVGEMDHMREVFTVMKRERVRRVPVTDEEGRLVGIIAQADLAVNYAGLDLQRETEVEEVIERISEPARPRGSMGGSSRMRRPAARGSHYDQDLTGRLREGWRMLRREAGEMFGRGYDRPWR